MDGVLVTIGGIVFVLALLGFFGGLFRIKESGDDRGNSGGPLLGGFIDGHDGGDGGGH